MRTVCGINDLGPPASLARHLISSAAVEPEAAAREDLRPCLGSLDPPGGISMKYRNILASLSGRSEEHTSELQSLMRSSYAVFCLKKNKINHNNIEFSCLRKQK